MVARDCEVRAAVRRSSSPASTPRPALMSPRTSSRSTHSTCRLSSLGTVEVSAPTMAAMASFSTTMSLTPASVRIHWACSAEEVS